MFASHQLRSFLNRIVDADLEEFRGGGCVDIDQLGDVGNRTGYRKMIYMPWGLALVNTMRSSCTVSAKFSV